MEWKIRPGHSMNRNCQAVLFPFTLIADLHLKVNVFMDAVINRKEFLSQAEGRNHTVQSHR